MHTFDFQVTWADLDSNAHLKNSRYLDYAAQARFLYLAAAGFTPQVKPTIPQRTDPLS